jgi:uncharacterized protein
MRDPPQACLLPDGRRLHLQHGPIDLIVEACGSQVAVAAAYEAASRRFATVLDELCGELPLLRLPALPGVRRCEGPVARRMEAAVLPHAARGFITPMAAVAGAVAQEILDAMVGSADLGRAYVNNGGDIALHLAPGTSFKIGLIDRPDRPGLFGSAAIRFDSPVRGVATSGWRGRSHSLGIADTVTILARTASEADAAATVVANAVDLPGHPAIRRTPADALQPDSDLGPRLVTVAVGALGQAEVRAALEAGAACADDLVTAGLIEAAALHLQGVPRTVGRPDDNPAALFSRLSLRPSEALAHA